MWRSLLDPSCPLSSVISWHIPQRTLLASDFQLLYTLDATDTGVKETFPFSSGYMLSSVTGPQTHPLANHTKARVYLISQAVDNFTARADYHWNEHDTANSIILTISSTLSLTRISGLLRLMIALVCTGWFQYNLKRSFSITDSTRCE